MARRTKEPAIIIKGLLVPKNCASCWYGIEHNFDDGGECFAAGILELTAEEFHGEYRPGKCPIVAVSVAGDSFAVDPTF